MFIIVCLPFRSCRSLLEVSCIFSILFPRFWIIFTIIPLNSFSGRLPISSSFVWSGGFYLAPSSALCFSVFSFCLSYCVLGLLSAGCRFVFPVVFGVCPLWLMLVQWVLYASWWRRLVPVFWWMRLDLVFLVGRTASCCVFWGVCEVIIILSRLSTNGWDCVPVLPVVWHRVSCTVACWLLSGAGS